MKAHEEVYQWRGPGSLECTIQGQRGQRGTVPFEDHQAHLRRWRSELPARDSELGRRHDDQHPAQFALGPHARRSTADLHPDWSQRPSRRRAGPSARRSRATRPQRLTFALAPRLARPLWTWRARAPKLRERKTMAIEILNDGSLHGKEMLVRGPRRLRRKECGTIVRTKFGGDDQVITLNIQRNDGTGNSWFLPIHAWSVGMSRRHELVLRRKHRNHNLGGLPCPPDSVTRIIIPIFWGHTPACCLRTAGRDTQKLYPPRPWQKTPFGVYWTLSITS